MAWTISMISILAGLKVERLQRGESIARLIDTVSADLGLDD
jgi:hypothetical protein